MEDLSEEQSKFTDLIPLRSHETANIFDLSFNEE